MRINMTKWTDNWYFRIGGILAIADKVIHTLMDLFSN